MERRRSFSNKSNYMQRKITCFDKDKNKYQVSVDKLKFRPAAYAVIIKNNKVLLSKQWDGYDFPGGGIKIGENIEKALAREVKEETGLNIEIGEIVACFNSFFKLPAVKKDEFIQGIGIYYLVEIKGGKISAKYLDKEEKKYADTPEWMDYKKIESIKFYNSADSVSIIKKAFKINKKR